MSDQPNEQEYLRRSCDHILQVTTTDPESERFEAAVAENDQLLLLPDQTPLESSQQKIQRRRAIFVRTLALLCACSLSVGSH